MRAVARPVHVRAAPLPRQQARQSRRVIERSSRRRLVALLVVMTVVILGITARLVDVQVVSADRYARLGLDQRVRTVQLAAERGIIFDRNGNNLAVSVPQQTVWADPRVVRDPTAYAAKLAPVLGIAEPELRGRLAQSDKAFVYLARKVDDDTAKRVKALQLPGVAFAPESKRNYPAGSLAAPLLGFAGLDNNGLAGLEVSADSVLSGTPGQVVVERDPQGRDIPSGTRRYQASQPGSDLVLTIDQSLQYETERVLTEETAATLSKGAMAVILDLQTGDVLAMATVDGASAGKPAHPATANEHNRPLTDVYEPGSTNKAITVAGAIEDGLVVPSTLFQVPDHIQVADATFTDHNGHPVTPWTVADIVRESSNVGAIMIGKELGKDRLDHYLRAFGLGSPTGLDFPGEAAGLLIPPDEYSGSSMGTVPIGNGLAVTAMQMLDVFATIANGGVMREPRLVGATVDSDGVRHDRPPAPVRRVVSTRTAQLMNGMLQSVVRSGTGTLAAVPGYAVAGKTGTARKPPYDRPPYKYVASFVGFVPAESPRLAGIVVLDEPQSAIYGGTVAAPVFARIMQYALRVEKILPTDPAASGGVVTSPGIEAATRATAPTTTTTPAAPTTAKPTAPTTAGPAPPTTARPAPPTTHQPATSGAPRSSGGSLGPPPSG